MKFLRLRYSKLGIRQNFYKELQEIQVRALQLQPGPCARGQGERRRSDCQCYYITYNRYCLMPPSCIETRLKATHGWYLSFNYVSARFMSIWTHEHLNLVFYVELCDNFTVGFIFSLLIMVFFRNSLSESFSEIWRLVFLKKNYHFFNQKPTLNLESCTYSFGHTF